MFFCLRREFRRPSRRGLTIVELMVAIGILAILSVVLVGISDSATKLWSQGESKNQARMRARAILDYMGRELRQASLAVNQSVLVNTNPTLAKSTLELLINPSGASGQAYPNNIFWQAPIATDDLSKGDMAEVGYFIRWVATTQGTHSQLCRYFVNPTSSDYLIYTAATGAWVTTANLSSVAPADNVTSHHYQGLFLENVLGLWTQAYRVDGTLLNAPGASYNTSAYTVHALPAYIVISIVVLDSRSSDRLAQNATAITEIQRLAQSSTDAPDAPSFMTFLLAEPPTKVSPGITRGASVASIKVSLDNYK